MTAIATHSAYYGQRHGGPFDRGHSDFYYGRAFNPHFFIGDTYSTPKIELAQMNAEEITAYTAGYRYGEELGDRKEW